jgi:hypothetical protein
MVPLKVEKENKFLDHCWVNTAVPILVVLVQGNKIFLLQHEKFIKAITALDFLTTNLYIVDVKEIVAENVDEYQGLNNMLDNIVSNKPLQDQQNAIELARTQLKTVHFNCLTNTKKGFVIGGDLGYISIFEIGSQFVVLNTLNFQIKFVNQTRTTIQ